MDKILTGYLIEKSDNKGIIDTASFSKEDVLKIANSIIDFNDVKMPCVYAIEFASFLTTDVLENNDFSCFHTLEQDGISQVYSFLKKSYLKNQPLGQNLYLPVLLLFDNANCERDIAYLEFVLLEN